MWHDREVGRPRSQLLPPKIVEATQDQGVSLHMARSFSIASIRAHLARHGIRRRDLAKLLGVHETLVSHWLCERRGIPPERALQMLRALDTLSEKPIRPADRNVKADAPAMKKDHSAVK